MALLQSKASAEIGSSTTFTVSFDNAVTVGSHIVVCSAHWHGVAATTIVTVADNKGNGNYVVGREQVFDTNCRIIQYYKSNVVTGGTSFQITITWGGACSGVVGVMEYSAINTADPLGTVNSGTGSSTNGSSGSAQGDTGAATLVACTGYNTGSPVTITENAAAFTQRLEIDENNDTQAINIADAVGLSGAQTCTWGFSGSVAWGALICAYNEVAGAPVYVPRPPVIVTQAVKRAAYW